MKQGITKFQTNHIESVQYFYDVKMDQIESTGAIKSSHRLQSEYVMTPGGNTKNECLFDARYQIKKMCYLPQGKKEREWKFAKDKEFLSVLFNIATEESMQYLQKEGGKKLLESQWQSISKLFEQFPKLPATGILHAFVFDLTGMDQMLSHILSCNQEYKDFYEWKIVNSLNQNKFDISVGVYDSGTCFTNGKMKAVILGTGTYQERVVSLYRFSCDDASFQVFDRDSVKKGYSYYNGTLAVDYETGVLYGAEMCEYIFSGGNSQLMRREVMMKAKNFVLR